MKILELLTTVSGQQSLPQTVNALIIDGFDNTSKLRVAAGSKNLVSLEAGSLLTLQGIAVQSFGSSIVVLFASDLMNVPMQVNATAGAGTLKIYTANLPQFYDGVMSYTSKALQDKSSENYGAGTFDYLVIETTSEDFSATLENIEGDTVERTAADLLLENSLFFTPKGAYIIIDSNFYTSAFLSNKTGSAVNVTILKPTNV